MDKVTLTVSRWKQNNDWSRTHEAFGIVDAKGREIGAFVATFTVTFFDVLEEYWNTPGNVESALRGKREPGVYPAFIVHATRNGKNYGASQATQIFNTEAERDAAIAKYLANAKKRAAR